MLGQLFEKGYVFAMLRIQHPADRGAGCRLDGDAAALDLTGFGKSEPAPIEPRRYGAPASCASSGTRSLASALPTAINAWGHFGLAKLLRQ